jgi:hypothetical protein
MSTVGSKPSNYDDPKDEIISLLKDKIAFLEFQLNLATNGEQNCIADRNLKSEREKFELEKKEFYSERDMFFAQSNPFFEDCSQPIADNNNLDKFVNNAITPNPLSPSFPTNNTQLLYGLAILSETVNTQFVHQNAQVEAKQNSLAAISAKITQERSRLEESTKRYNLDKTRLDSQREEFERNWGHFNDKNKQIDIHLAKISQNELFYTNSLAPSLSLDLHRRQAMRKEFPRNQYSTPYILRFLLQYVKSFPWFRYLYELCDDWIGPNEQFNGVTLLQLAVTFLPDPLECLEYLVGEKNAAIDLSQCQKENDPFFLKNLIIKNRSVDLLKYLIKNHGYSLKTDNLAVLHLACDSINRTKLDLFEYLIEMGECTAADLNKKSGYITPLHSLFSSFTDSCDIGIVKLLCNQPDVDLSVVDSRNYTCVDHLFLQYQPSSILLTHVLSTSLKLHINIPNPFLVLCSHLQPNLDCIKLFAENIFVDFSQIDQYNGHTALQIVARFTNADNEEQRLPILRYLIEKGVPINSLGYNGDTLLDIVTPIKHLTPVMYQLFIANGALLAADL